MLHPAAAAQLDVLAQDNWTLMSPAASAFPRFDHAMAYIGDDQVLLFGGFTGSLIDDTWVYDLSDNTWTRKFPASRPSPRDFHAMAYIGGDQVLLFGGLGAVGAGFDRSDETWVYDLSDNTWTQRFPPTKPSARLFHAMANIGGDQVLLFGGSDDPSGNGSDETWVYDLSDNTWTLKSPASKPPGRHSHAMASIGGDQVLLFSGGPSNDETWVYDLSDNSWTQKFPLTKPYARFIHAMAYMEGDQVLLFGGQAVVGVTEPGGSDEAIVDDTWVYDLSDNTWTQEFPATHPSKRFSHAMASIGGGQVVLFGGADYDANSNLLVNNETWVHAAGPTPNRSPVAGPGGPYSGTEGTALAFDGAASSDPDGDPLTFSWDFGDGTSAASGSSPSHTYSTSGTFTVTLTVSDGSLSSSAATTATIANVAPTVSPPSDGSTTAGEAFGFSGSFSDPGTGDGPWTYTVDWGDGSPNEMGTSSDPSAPINGSHLYAGYGSFTVTLTVTDSHGATSSSTFQVSVADRPPLANAGGPYAAAEGAPVNLDGTGSSDPDGDPLTYSWDFGDGSPVSTAQSPSHTYADNGNYPVTLSVNDGHLTATATALVAVANVPPGATFTTNSPVREGADIKLALINPTDPSSADVAVGFMYAFDCGSGYAIFSASATAICPTVDNGQRAVRAKIRDKDGGVSDYAAIVTVTNAQPLVQLRTDRLAGRALTVIGTFTDFGSADAPWTYTITWGDGASSIGTASTPSASITGNHTYAAHGVYQVRLRVKDKDGGTGASNVVAVQVR